FDAKWHIQNELIPNPEDIKFKDEGSICHAGAYAQTNITEKQKTRLTQKEVDAWKATHNPTMLEQITSGRVPLSSREKRYWTKEPVTLVTDFGMQIGWDSGKAWVKPVHSKENPSRFKGRR
ncbi:MAG: hypothetical protein H0U49_00900, partial [Parachlamydiaceae bacterium]|nr:hypothetical protein [Parachlamydiaceae bacterium]